MFWRFLLPSGWPYRFLRRYGSVDRYRRNLCRSWCTDFQLLTEFGVYFGEGFLVVLEIGANIFATLADALARVAVPCARLLDDVVGYRQIENIAFARDTLAIENIELSLAEGRGDLVLDDLDLGARANDRIAFLDGRNAADIDADRGIELERAATGGGFRIAEHDADLFADLVDENQTGARFRDRAGQFAQRL